MMECSDLAVQLADAFNTTFDAGTVFGSLSLLSGFVLAGGVRSLVDLVLDWRHGRELS